MELAQAAAVAGERGRVEDIAALAGTSVAEARAGLEQLAAVRVLHPGGWTFVHPLVRAAVVRSIPHSRKTELHSGAATQLRVRGAKPAEVAAHLMVVEPIGDPGTIVTLREAARAVTAEGAPDMQWSTPSPSSSRVAWPSSASGSRSATAAPPAPAATLDPIRAAAPQRGSVSRPESIAARVGRADLDAVADELNDRPRKRLAFAKPSEEIADLLWQ